MSDHAAKYAADNRTGNFSVLIVLTATATTASVDRFAIAVSSAYYRRIAVAIHVWWALAHWRTGALIGRFENYWWLVAAVVRRSVYGRASVREAIRNRNTSARVAVAPVAAIVDVDVDIDVDVSASAAVAYVNVDLYVGAAASTTATAIPIASASTISGVAITTTAAIPITTTAAIPITTAPAITIIITPTLWAYLPDSNLAIAISDIDLPVLSDDEIVAAAVLLAIIDVSYDVCEVASVVSIDILQNSRDALTIATVEISRQVACQIVTAMVFKSGHGYIL